MGGGWLVARVLWIEVREIISLWMWGGGGEKEDQFCLMDHAVLCTWERAIQGFGSRGGRWSSMRSGKRGEEIIWGGKFLEWVVKEGAIPP